jgi:hypothetical protein
LPWLEISAKNGTKTAYKPFQLAIDAGGSLKRQKAAQSRLAVPLVRCMNSGILQLHADLLHELVHWQTLKQLAELLRAINLRPPLALTTGKALLVVRDHELGLCRFAQHVEKAVLGSVHASKAYHFRVAHES